MEKFKNKNYLIIIIITIFSFIISPGYKTLTSDQQIYYPSILKIDNPELFSGDIISFFEQANFTFFDDLIRLSAKLFNNDLYIATFLLAVIFRFLFFFSIFNICLTITKNKKISIIFTIISTITTSVYGTGIFSIYPELLPRFTGYSLGFLYLFFFIKNKKTISSIILGMAVLMHPLAASPFLLFNFIMYAKFFINNKKIKLIEILQLTIPLFGVVALLIFGNEGEKMSILSVIDPLWESIIKYRDPYIFISSWKKIGYFSFIIDLAILAFFGKSLIKNIDKKYTSLVIILFFFIPLIMTFSHFILSDIFKISFFAQAQLHRSLIFIKMSVFLVLINIFMETEKLIKNGDEMNSGLILLPAYMTGKIEIFLPVLIFFLSEKFGLWIFNKKNIIKLIFLALSIIQFLIVVFVLQKSQLESSIILFLAITSLSLWFVNKKIKNKKILTALAALFSIPPLLAVNNIVNIKFFLAIAMIINLLIILSAINDLIKKHCLFPSLIILSFVAISPYFKLYPKNFNNQDLYKICGILKNDNTKGLVMIDNKIPIASDIRMFCRKGIYYSRKDGAQVVFNRSYAIEWKRREDFSKNFFENPENSIKNVKNIAKENISFIISLNNIIGFPEPIFTTNDGVKIWGIKKNEE